MLALALTAMIAAPASAAAVSWVPQPTAMPAGAATWQFHSVSCGTARFCVGVGSTGPSVDAGSALAERWNGVGWTVEPVPLPTNTRYAALTDVSCRRARSCLAVGMVRTQADAFVPIAEHREGSQWTLLSPALAPGAVSTYVRAVTCLRPRECVAAGVAYYPGPGRFSVPRPLIERWDGARWTVEPTEDPGAFDLSLDDVSCSGSDACTAVGFSDSAETGQVPLVERWDGTAWRLQATPRIPDQVYNQFSGVSCPRRRFCEAVGFVSTSTTTQGIAERWDGTAWTVEATPGPLSGASQLLGVTCAARGRCSAVGEVLSSPTGNELPLSERRTVTGWKVEPTPLPAGGAFGRLWGVSCSGQGSCTAVGWWGTGSSPLRALAERRSR